MNQEEVVVEGTLKDDGRLELDEKPALEPGRVTVHLRSKAPQAPSTENWWHFMQRTRRELEASGSPFMNEKEIAVHIDWLREEDPIDELLRRPTAPPSTERL